MNALMGNLERENPTGERRSIRAMSRDGYSRGVPEANRAANATVVKSA